MAQPADYFPDDFKTLREKAEILLNEQGINVSQLDRVEIEQLVHELRVYQIELEMQNDTLRETQQELEAAKDAYAHLYEFAPIGYATLDVEGKFVQVNLTTTEMLGLERQFVLGQPLTRFIHPDDQDIFYLNYRRLSQGHPPGLFELRLTTQKASTLFGQFSCDPVYDAEGRVTQIRVAITDITVFKEAQLALQHGQKLKSLGTLAGGIAHDFNNLLTVILGQVSLASLELEPNHPVQNHLDKALKAIDRTTKLTEQMLAYSGQGHFLLKVVDLNAIIKESLELLQTVVPKRINLELKLASKKLLIKADGNQIQQVLINLVINAGEAIGDRMGTVTVRTGSQMIACQDLFYSSYTGTPLEAGRYVYLEVQDDGVGMDREPMSKLFDPFFSTKFTGRGLGLAVVLGIVRGHKGGVTVSSRVGHGSTFRLVFPVSDLDLELQEPREDVGWTGNGAGLILIIDDEDAVREVAHDILQARGFRVITAENGLDGIAKYSEHAAEIDLILLDYSMPGLNGEETLNRLREINPEVKALLLSGYTEQEVINRFTGQKLAGFLQKPYSLKKLVELVKHNMAASLSREVSLPKMD